MYNINSGIYDILYKFYKITLTIQIYVALPSSSALKPALAGFVHILTWQPCLIGQRFICKDYNSTNSL
jgi:hypothetical protein